MRRSILIIVLSFITLVQLLGQKVEDKVEIAATYDSINQSILIRWAPNSSDLWFYANEYGYTLEKYVYQRDGELLEVPLEKTVIGSELKPAPLNDWEGEVNQDDYAAIAAQSIYGEYLSFQEASSDIFSIVNKSREQDSRFSMSLFAADQSRKAAELSGLFYEDFDVDNNERYLYRVYANVSDSIVPADTGKIFFGPKDYSPLPKPIMSHAEQENGMVQVYWLKAPYHSIYTSYIVQKSQQNKDFEDINKLPVLNIEAGPTNGNRYGVYLDTTKLQGSVYYRVIGVDAFGQKSTPSDTLEIQIMPEFVMPMPVIDTIYSEESGITKVKYSVTGDEEFGKKIFLERSNKADGRYSLVDKKETYGNYYLSDSAALFNSYYRIGIEVYGTIQYSMPSLFNLVDSIPPAKPEFSNYTVNDSLVKLEWKKGLDKDIAGYRIYKAQYEKQEPSEVSEIKEAQTSITLKENLNFINNERYYYLVAVDQVGNASEMSDPFKIQLPDIVPPATPIIRDVIEENETLNILYKKSSSKDLKHYLLYLKSGNSPYKLEGVNSFDTYNFSHSIAGINNQNLLLRLVAVDSSGNEAVSKPFPYKVRNRTLKEPKYTIQITDENVEIYWETIVEGIKTVRIYLRNEGKLTIFKEVDFQKGEFSLKKSGVEADDFKLIFI